MEAATVWDIFSSGPILDTLGKHLKIGDIVSLSRTCTALSGMYREVKSRQWDVDSLLKRFVKSPREFRRHIGLAQALITGSFALEFFERPGWQAPNLDVVVKDALGLDLLCQYLAQDDYVRFDKYDDGCGPHVFRHVERVVTLKRSYGTPPKTMHLYEISPHAFPVKSVVEGAWTTACVNFISWRQAYSVFPSSTFIHSKAFLLERLGRNYDMPLQKYRARGFDFEIATSALQSRRYHPMQKCRKTGDKFTWKIPLDTNGITVPSCLEPVPEDDIVWIGEEWSEMGATEWVECGLPMVEPEAPVAKAHHYEAKYMRYSGLYT